MTSSDSSVTLTTGDCEATVDLHGGGISHLTWRGLDMVEGYGRPGEPTTAPLTANAVLAPWPNRTADGRFTVDGDIHQLTITEPARNTALHGFVTGQRWTVAAQETGTLTLTLDPGPQPGWPWPLHLTLTYTVDDDGLAAVLTVRNDSSATAPVACGFHLYPSALGAATDECRLLVPEHTVIPLDGRGLPTGPAETDRGVLPAGTNPLAGRDLDHCLQLTGEAPGEFSLVRPDGGGVVLRTSPEFRWFQVFTPGDRTALPYPGRPDGRAVAVEPMTAPPDALNSGDGLARLPPGTGLTCSWVITVIPPAG
jgi:aldose 1-epimerase